MDSIIRDLVAYQGIEKKLYNSSIFKIKNIESSLYLPLINPSIDNLIKVTAKTKIKYKEFIETPKGISNEGQKLTGCKLFVMGEVGIKYEYSSQEESHSIYLAKISQIFSESIVMPENFIPYEEIYALISIQDINSEKVNSRCIYSNINIILSVDI